MEYIIGVIVSLVVQFIKKKWPSDTTTTMLVVLTVSFIGAASYVLLMDTPFWPTILQVITVAGAFYAFIIKRFETQ